MISDWTPAPACSNVTVLSVDRLTCTLPRLLYAWTDVQYVYVRSQGVLWSPSRKLVQYADPRSLVSSSSSSSTGRGGSGELGNGAASSSGMTVDKLVASILAVVLCVSGLL